MLHTLFSPAVLGLGNIYCSLNGYAKALFVALFIYAYWRKLEMLIFYYLVFKLPLDNMYIY